MYLDVFVTDGNRPVVGLTASDFELRDNGARRAVELVAVESLHLTTFLVLDTSGSVAGEKLLRLQAAGRALLGGLRADDEASLVTFDQEVKVRVPPTSDRPRLERAVSGILPGGATALYDALYAGTLLASGRGRSLLVLFTDGEDNLSWLDAAQVRRVLLESNVLVQAVGIVPREEATTRDFLFVSRPGVEPPHVRTLRHARRGDGRPLLGGVGARRARGRVPRHPGGDEDALRPPVRARPREARGAPRARGEAHPPPRQSALPQGVLRRSPGALMAVGTDGGRP